MTTFHQPDSTLKRNLSLSRGVDCVSGCVDDEAQVGGVMKLKLVVKKEEDGGGERGEIKERGGGGARGAEAKERLVGCHSGCFGIYYMGKRAAGVEFHSRYVPNPTFTCIRRNNH